MKYVFRCWRADCPKTVFTAVRTPAPTCPLHGDMRRDYKAEAVNINRGSLR